MKIRTLVASIALAGVSVTWAAISEPIQPIKAAKVADPALTRHARYPLVRPSRHTAIHLQAAP